MWSIGYLVAVALLARGLQRRVRWLAGFDGMPGYLLALGLTLFGAAWADFLTYVLCGWGADYVVVTWAAVLVPLGLLARGGGWGADVREGWASLRAARGWNFAFLFFAAFVLMRYYAGLETIDGEVWCNFNFVDTAFHLSVANAFLAAPKFPPVDLDMAPFPLKYHFLADFFVAHLVTLGQSRLTAMWLMNLVSAAAMVGAIWATFQRWLKLSARWVLLAGLLFLFLNTALVNLVHFAIFRPEFFRPATPFDGLFTYPFFNFESMLTNLLEPQRGLLFTLPVVLLILHLLFGDEDAADESAAARRERRRPALLAAFALICLLPFSHIVAFAVLALAAVPKLWPELRWLAARWRWWSVPLAIGFLQLAYLYAYGPPPNSNYAAWLTFSLLPPLELTGASRVVRRLVFWFFADGDFLLWGGVLGLLAWRWAPLRAFLRRWGWFYVVCLGCFVVINFFRYTFDWGDSNKFVLFLNLGLVWVIVIGAARWVGRSGAWRSHALWGFFFALSVAVPAYEFYRDVYQYPDGKILLFQKSAREAAAWLRQNTQPSDVVLTAAYNVIHFVTPLAGRPTVAGIYGNSNVYRQNGRRAEIQRIYEEGDLALVHRLGVRYVCISANERRRYKISPRWQELQRNRTAVAFQSGALPDFASVYIFDAHALPDK